MNIVVTGRKVEVTPSLRKYAEDKIGKLERYLTKITEVTVTLSVQKQMHKADVLIKANGTVIQAEAVTEELYSAIDEVASKLDRQVKKFKGKITSRRKAAQSKASAVASAEAPAKKKAASSRKSGNMIERMRYVMKPMPPEEAAMQLDISDQSFFVFTNSESGETNVIFRRSDGNLGLIEPVIK